MWSRFQFTVRHADTDSADWRTEIEEDHTQHKETEERRKDANTSDNAYHSLLVIPREKGSLLIRKLRRGKTTTINNVADSYLQQKVQTLNLLIVGNIESHHIPYSKQ